MGPELASNSATDGLIWAHYWSHMCCQWSCMGPALVQTHGIVWAQHWSQNILPIILYGPRAGLNRLGPALVPKYVTNCLAWAQHLPQNMVLMVLYGPGICFKIYSQSSCMGPELAPNSATDGLIW